LRENQLDSLTTSAVSDTSGRIGKFSRWQNYGA